MSTARRIRRLAIASGLALALTGSTLSAAAVAMPDRANVLVPSNQAPVAGAPRMDDAARERRLAVARAQERYYSSYGQPGRPSVSQASVGTESHDGSRLAIALSILGGIGVAAASAIQLRRLRIRRRRAAGLLHWRVGALDHSPRPADPSRGSHPSNKEGSGWVMSA